MYIIKFKWSSLNILRGRYAQNTSSLRNRNRNKARATSLTVPLFWLFSTAPSGCFPEGEKKSVCQSCRGRSGESEGQTVMSRERSHRDVDPQQFILIKEDLQKKKEWTGRGQYNYTGSRSLDCTLHWGRIIGLGANHSTDNFRLTYH